MARNVSKDKKLRPNGASAAKPPVKKDAKPNVTDKTAKSSGALKSGAAKAAAPPKNGKSAAAKVAVGGKSGKPSKEADKGKKDPERSVKDAGKKDASKSDPGKKDVAKGAAAKGAAKSASDGTKSKEQAGAKSKEAPPKRKRKSSVVRLKAYWGVFNQMLKRVAVFEYAERKQADKKASELSTSAKQPHFVQLVKEVIRDED